MEEKIATPTDQQLDEAQKQAQELSDLISQIEGPGYSAVLWRLAPTWCDGYLEEFDIDPEAGLDMDYICRMWGGHKHTLRLKNSKGQWVRGATLKLKSWKPRHRGVILSRFDDFNELNPGRGQPPGTNTKYRQGPSHQPAFQPPPAQTFDPNKMMEQMFGMFKDFQKTMAKASPPTENPALLAGPAAIPSDPMGQMMQGLKMYKEMQKVFGQGDSAMSQESDSGESALFGSIGQILSMMNRQPAAPAQQPALPIPQQQPQTSLVRNDGVPTPPRMDLPGAIAALSPSQIGDMLVSAASRMGQEQREQAFAEVATRLSGLDDVEYEDDDPSTMEESEYDESSIPEPSEPISDTD